LRDEFVERCLNIVEEYCPGFKESILHVDALSPLDLEEVFGLPQGNFHHGALSLPQLLYGRAQHRCPEVAGLYLCGAGTHPGGGVMGAAGRIASRLVLRDLDV
jgi:phytoene dehydrogenase-like protein